MCVLCVDSRANENHWDFKSLNDEAGAGTKILTTSSIQSAATVFNMANVPLPHVSDYLFCFDGVVNALDSLDNALNLILST
jgi:hypothetical protein